MKQGFLSTRLKVGFSLIAVIVVGFFLLDLQIRTVSNTFIDDFDDQISVLDGDFSNSEFRISVPVPIISIEGEGDTIAVRYHALGGLIGGERIIDLSTWSDEFDTIESKGFFLPGRYDVTFSLTEDSSLLLEFFPA